MTPYIAEAVSVRIDWRALLSCDNIMPPRDPDDEDEEDEDEEDPAEEPAVVREPDED
jgi:hypothetical protein